MQVLSDGGKTNKGDTVKRFLLLAVLSMVAVFVFAPAALADNHNMMMDDEMMEEEMMMEEDDSATATATADDDESASASAEADDESATATASASAQAVDDLPDTGGVSPALLTVLPALLLVGSGVMAVRVIRRN